MRDSVTVQMNATPDDVWALNTWRYELVAVEGGTELTESFALERNVFTSLY